MPNSDSKGLSPAKRIHQDHSKDISKAMCECQVRFLLVWVEAYRRLS